MSEFEPPGSWKERRTDVRDLVPGFKDPVHKLIVWLEWCCEWIAYWLSRWAFLNILGHVGRLGLLFAIYAYVTGGDARQAQKNAAAWQVINTAKAGNAGRVDALEQLLADGVQLNGIDLSLAWLNDYKLFSGTREFFMVFPRLGPPEWQSTDKRIFLGRLGEE